MRDIQSGIQDNLDAIEKKYKVYIIREECARQKQISDALPDDHCHDYTELNEAFRNYLVNGDNAIPQS